MFYWIIYITLIQTLTLTHLDIYSYNIAGETFLFFIYCVEKHKAKQEAKKQTAVFFNTIKKKRKSVSRGRSQG